MLRKMLELPQNSSSEAHAPRVFNILLRYAGGNLSCIDGLSTQYAGGAQIIQ